MDNQIQGKSYQFALRMIRMYRHLTEEKREFVLSKQLLRSGTSIGANVRESEGAQSKSDFLSKIQIAHKESLETEYWLMLLRDSHIVSEKASESILSDCREIIKILSSIILTTKHRMQ